MEPERHTSPESIQPRRGSEARSDRHELNDDVEGGTRKKSLFNDSDAPTDQTNPDHIPVKQSFLTKQLRRLRASRWATINRAIRSHVLYSILMLVVTLFAVFADEFRAAVLTKSTDEPINKVITFCFSVFVFDIFCSCLFEAGYAFSLMFTLDLVATLGMILEPLVAGGGSRKLALARIARVVRLIRIMRFAKFARVSQEGALIKAEQQRAREQLRAEASWGVDEPDDQTNSEALSSTATVETRNVNTGKSDRWKQRLGSISAASAHSATGTESESGNRSMLASTLMALTTEKIVLLVLFLALGIQLLQFDAQDSSEQVGVCMLREAFDAFESRDCFENVTSTGNNVCQGFLDVVDGLESALGYSGYDTTIRVLVIKNVTIFNQSISKFRDTEIVTVTCNGDATMTVSLYPFTAAASLFTLFEAVLILLLLLIFPYLFGRDVLSLVVSPLESIYDRVLSIAGDPFQNLVPLDTTRHSLELIMIQKVLTTLTQLLRVGLGQAGQQIIALNLASKKFSAMRPGQMTSAIFGFCEIRNFSECCEPLQRECLDFSNAVAAMVATQVASSRGAVNKNLGDAFLLVWKWTDSSEVGHSGPPINSSKEEAAEASLVAAVNMIKNVARNATLQAYAKRPEVQAALGPHFQVTIGVGLHTGWAVEGAVGTEYKIDATYLSPTVNTAARVQTGTRQYGVSLLMSNSFYDCLGTSQRQCRRVDCVAVKGSTQPITLWTYVLSDDWISIISASEAYFTLYEKGDWSSAERAIGAFLKTWPQDGPAATLLEFMAEHKFVAPNDWGGYRKLLNK
eukprot:c18380_g1_i3.p1 GENE.c18380_g1_i3~~c18380_g1_i3.p1  ORF type:complete len:812 (+),score=165.17 c18380_g1_i3:39-2438(+)